MINKNSITNVNIKKINIYIYCIFLMLSIFLDSMYNLPNFLFNLRTYLIILLGIISLFFTQHTLEEYIILTIGIFITGVGIIQNPNLPNDYFLMVLIFFCFSNINPKKILIYSSWTCGISLAIIFLSAKMGIIPDLIFNTDGIVRHAFGMSYSLHFAAYIFYILAAILLLKKRGSFWYLFILVIIGSWISTNVNARNDAIGIFLLALIELVRIYNPKKVLRIATLVLSYIVGIGCFLSIFITRFIPYNSNLFFILNKIFNSRLQLQYELWNFYTPRLFGQFVYQQGNGGFEGLATNRMFYFYIDNSYAKLLFISGILFLLFFSYISIRMFTKFNKLNLYIAQLVILLIFVNGISEDSLITIGINFFLPIFFSRINLLKKNFDGIEV